MVLGPLIFLVFYACGPFGEMNNASHAVLSCTLWIAFWWMTEAVPIPITSLLPIILFPLTGALDIANTTASFGHPLIFLYVGGFILAIAIEKWNLHKRIALYVLLYVGNKSSYIVLGFMIATAFLSMWISNTATAVMMLPIGIATIKQLESGQAQHMNRSFAKVLMLGIAYSASIGGMATIIGTPPNLVLVAVTKEYFGVDIDFFSWLRTMLPLCILLLFICWKYLIKAFKLKSKTFPLGNQEIKRQFAELGKMGFEEKAVLSIFIFTAFCWISRSFILDKWLPAIDDTVIAIMGAVLLFVMPGKDRKPLIKWDDAKKLPWGIVLLFGGGLAIAAGFKDSGLTEWIGAHFTLMEGVSLVLMLLVVIGAVNFLTEITSNTATTALILPILAPIAITLDVHPLSLMVGAALSASCAFMLPVATPPNAVVFGSGYFSIREMARIGLLLNVLSIFLILLFMYFVLPYLWGIDLFSFPESFGNFER